MMVTSIVYMCYECHRYLPIIMSKNRNNVWT